MRLSLLSLFFLLSLCLRATDLLPLRDVPVLPDNCEAPFAYFYGNEMDDFGGHTITTDGSFLYIGGRQNDMAIVSKFLPDGQLIWSRSLNLSSFSSQIIDLKLDREGYLIGCGHTYPASSLDDGSSFAFKLDTEVGDVIWAQVYAEDNSSYFLANDLLDRAAGEPYLLLGNAEHSGSLNTGCDATFYALNRNNGTLTGINWHYNLGSCETFAAGLSIDGNVYATGRFNFSNSDVNRMRPAVISLDGMGNPIWSRLYLEDINRDARLFSSHMVQDGNDHLVIAAHGDQDGTSLYSNDAWLIRLNRVGRAQWARKFTFPEAVRSEEVLALGGNGYMLLTSAPEQNRLYLTRIDGLGQLLWSRRIDEVTVTPAGNEMTIIGGQVYLTTTLQDTDRQRLALFRFQAENGALPFDCIPSDTLSPILRINSTPYNGFNAVSPYTATPRITNSMLSDFTDLTALEQSCLPDCELEEICDNEEDDDGDGLTDCDDPDLADDCCCHTPPLLELGPDQSRCDGTPVILELSEEFTHISWSTGDTTNTLSLINSGTYSVTVSDRCDNLQSDTITLVLGTSVETNETWQICPGETVEVFGQPQSGAGDYTQSFPLASGCDSLHTITLVVLPQTSTRENLTICQGESVVLFGSSRTESGEYTASFTDRNGCDSTHTVDLEVLPPILTTASRTICAGDSTLVFGNFEQLADTYTATFSSAAGCDSTHQLELIVLEPVLTSETLPLQCAGSTVDLFGQTVSESGRYEGVFAASNGCDSIHQVTVNFAEPIVGRDTLVICPGESVDIYGVMLSEPGDYSRTFAASNGCDSTHITTLQEENIRVSFNIFPNCPSTVPGFLVYVRIRGNAGPYQVSWNGRNFYRQTLQPVPPGEHVVTITTANGCIYEQPFTIDDPRDSWWWALQQLPTCTNPKGGSVAIAHDLPGLSYSLDSLDFTNQPNIENLEAGNYPIYLKYGNGCTLTDSLQIPAPMLPEAKLPADRTVKVGEVSRIIPLSAAVPGHFYQWRPEQTLNCKDCYQVIARPNKDTEYEFVVRDADGCENSDRIWIFVEADHPYYLPNVFSPNRDGLNDYFTLFAGAEVREIKAMHIYDRWGEQVYLAQNFPPNIEKMGWDGSFRNRPMPAGTYAYFLRIELADGTVTEVKGAVNLLR
jgi:gliding motility-associated-like protein